ncbi:MAG: T9SS type A sorting domain-containing protein [Candidatus Latescibacterota bacterium]
MMVPRQRIRLAVASGVLAVLVPSSVLGCYAVVAGRDASVDGSVLLGHNEDSATGFVNFRRVPRLQHPPGTTVTTDQGGTLPEVPETYSYLWSEHPTRSFARQSGVEAEALRLHAAAPESAAAYLTRYAARQSLSAVELTRYMTEVLARGAPPPDLELSEQVTASAVTPAVVRAGVPATVSVSVVLDLSSGTTAEAADLGVDLSSFGLLSPMPLTPQEGGRHSVTTTVVPERNGRYTLLVLSTPAGGEVRGLRAASLDVYPAGDVAIYSHAPGAGWAWRAEGKATVDTAAAITGYEGRTALGIHGTGIMVVRAEAAVPVSSIGFDSLRLAVCPGEVELRALKVTLNGKAGGRDLSRWVDWANRSWQQVTIPLDSLGLREPWEEIRSLEIKGRVTGDLWVDGVSLVAAPMPAPTAVREVHSPSLPSACALHQNYPNPFNHSTVIRFALARTQPVELAVFDLAGQQVVTLVRGERPSGRYAVQWDGRDGRGRALASGVYLYRLRAGAQEQSRKLLLVK